jgi:hypothetical protein
VTLNSIKCTGCGLMNFAASPTCRRCDTPLAAHPEPPLVPAATYHGRSFGRWLIWIAGVTLTILVTAYASLLVTSQPLSAHERQVVTNAILVLDEAGFSSEASALRHLVSFRQTDNWWNRYVGHPTAYAATNFPFAVITIYPAFFRFPVDDTERATILLHESYHLFGDDEKFALQRVWLAKERLGWTSLRYSHTRVWKNTREWTVGAVPSMFTCGDDGRSDCLE